MVIIQAICSSIGSPRPTIHGIVYDDQAQRLSDVNVTGKLLGAGTFANGSDTLTTTTQVGSYALNGTPTGQTVLVTVSKNGFTTRQQTIVPLSNLQGDPVANRLDFGDATVGEDAFSMTDMPEVLGIEPKPGSTDIATTPSIRLTFSEPVKREDVERGLAITAASESTANISLSSGTQLVPAFSPLTDTFSGQALMASGAAIFKATDFNFVWSENDTVVTATLKSGLKLPTDVDGTKVPTFAVGLMNAVSDATGTGIRSSRFFRINSAQIGRNAFIFTVGPEPAGH